VDDPLVRIDGLREMARLYAEDNLRHLLASPLIADFQGFPPLLVEVGIREALIDDARRVVEKARRSGVETS
jgi:acetyl esterase/lipase